MCAAFFQYVYYEIKDSKVSANGYEVTLAYDETDIRKNNHQDFISGSAFACFGIDGIPE